MKNQKFFGHFVVFESLFVRGKKIVVDDGFQIRAQPNDVHIQFQLFDVMTNEFGIAI